MATAKKPVPKARSARTPGSPPRTPRSSATDAVKLLTAEHREVKALFQEYQHLVDHDADDDEDPSDALYDAKVKVPGEYIDHHVKEEEGELFPQARRAKLDLEAIGLQIVERKSALMAAFDEVEASDAAHATA